MRSSYVALNEVEFFKNEIESLEKEMSEAVSEGRITIEQMYELSDMLGETFENFLKERGLG
jgi:hypothetical protein